MVTCNKNNNLTKIEGRIISGTKAIA